MQHIRSKNHATAMQINANAPIQIPSTRKYHVQMSLTYEVKRKLEQRVKRLFVNEEFVEFIQDTVKKMPAKDKLATLYYFKKLAVQTLRQPDPDHYKAFEDVYTAHICAIQDEQKHYNPVKWIKAEIEYSINTAERLTAEDVNERLNILTEAKQRLSKDWLTQEEVMELFKISKSTLGKRRSSGMPFYKRGKAVHFYLSEISEWMKKDEA